MIGKAFTSVLILLASGCEVQSPYDRSHISSDIKERTGYELRQVTEPREPNLPHGVSLDDGLSEDEAVAIALWNNAQFQADLTALGFSRADLIEANMLANPEFSLLFPIGPKLLEAGLSIPVQALWQRPRRIAAAQFDAQSLSENLVEHGLGLIRDVQTAYADLWLAQEQARLAEEDAQLQIRMADLARGRLEAGDISNLAASAAYVDSFQAADAAKRFSNEAIIARQQLVALLGLISNDTGFGIMPSDIVARSEMSVDELLETALAARPDLRAAELKIEAAGKRLGWEQSKIYNLIAVIDAKDEGEDSLTVGPGLAVEIPVFNQNNGGIVRARAELEQATRQYEAVRQNIILEVRQAHTRYVSAHEEFELWNNHIVPSLEKALEQTQESLVAGEVSYLSVLEAGAKLVEARMHWTELAANLRRSAAQLNYRIGKKMI
ncbi:MAG: TolC family protein [Phycisphaerae bacterium]|nr:TolC family protein [Phycisphaerae bacterium]